MNSEMKQIEAIQDDYKSNSTVKKTMATLISCRSSNGSLNETVGFLIFCDQCSPSIRCD